jgi:hypothetical protein
MFAAEKEVAGAAARRRRDPVGHRARESAEQNIHNSLVNL